MAVKPVVLALSRSGEATAHRVAAALDAAVHGRKGRVDNADAFFPDALEHACSLFAARTPIVGVCAAGILVRAVAPLLADKRAEPPVVAVSDDGAVVVPLLGGHRGANRLARRLEPYDPLWLEEPTPPENPTEMARVARQTTIPIATGERLATKYEFARVLEAGAASILQLALGRVGGLLEAKKIAGMAETHYAQIAPHLYCGPVEGAANIQISAGSPKFLILESIQDWSGFHAEILKTPIRWEEGYVIPPSAPGLGV